MAINPPPSSSVLVKDGRLRPLWRAVTFSVVVLVWGAFVIGSLLLVQSRVYHGQPPAQTWVALNTAGGFVLVGGVIAAALLLRRYLDLRSIASLGFPFRPGWARLLLLGIAFGAGAQLLVFALELATGSSRIVGFGSLADDLKGASGAIPVLFFAALVEEVPLRGYLLQNFWEEWGFWPAAVITSVLFAFLHLGNPNAGAHVVQTLAGLAAFGLFAALSVAWTRSVWLVLGMHFTWNYFEGRVFDYPMSGLLPHGSTVIQQVVTGPAWLTGGAFGPEAGVSELAAIAVAATVLYVMYKRGAFAKAPDAREPYAREPSPREPT
jgi:membrane protease YdiL (CAAX protease family)